MFGIREGIFVFVVSAIVLWFYTRFLWWVHDHYGLVGIGACGLASLILIHKLDKRGLI